MSYLVFKALHIVFMVTWFAGLFYLPRLFVYHASAEDTVGIERFKVMERKLLWGIATPSGVLTLLAGGMLLAFYPSGSILLTTTWLQWKLVLVALLAAYHIWCIAIWHRFKHDQNTRSHIWYRWFNEAPVLVLVGVVFLAVLKPQ